MNPRWPGVCGNVFKNSVARPDLKIPGLLDARLEFPLKLLANIPGQYVSMPVGLRKYSWYDHSTPSKQDRNFKLPYSPATWWPEEFSEYFLGSGNDQQKVLLFTNTKKVWRLNTRGDYWIFNFKTKTLTQVGKSLPSSSLMFAKFSPDGTKVAFVSENNLYTED